MATFEMHDDCDNRGGACSDCRNLRWSFKRVHDAWSERFEDDETLCSELEALGGPDDETALGELCDKVQSDFDRFQEELLGRAGWSAKDFYEALQREAGDWVRAARDRS